MKYKLGLIGLGRITEEYLYGLNHNPNFKVVAICDKRKDARGTKLYKGTFYQDYKKMIKKEVLDYVLICTYPYTHYEIAKYCLKHKKNVILEKPAVLNLKDFDKLVKLTKKYFRDLEYMFHWRCGEEVKQFRNKYNMNDITSIDVSINDPYCYNGETIKSERISLEGCWIDSGVNVLSFIDYLIGIKSYKIIKNKGQKDTFVSQPVHTYTELLINDKIRVNIEIDWTKNKDNKISKVHFGNKEVIIDHSNQTIIDNNKKMEFNNIPRLPRHYYNFFNNFEFYNLIDVNQARIIHEILFKVGEIKYEEKESC